MPTIYNFSPSNSDEQLYPVILSSFPDSNPFLSIDTSIPPGSVKVINPSGLEGHRYFVFFYNKNRHIIWSGRLYPNDYVNVHPLERYVTYRDLGMTIEDLKTAKIHLPSIISQESIDENYLFQIKQHAKNKDPNALQAVIDSTRKARIVRDQGFELTDCVIAWGDVGINIISMCLNLQSVWNRLEETDRINIIRNMYNRLENGQAVDMLKEEFIDLIDHFERKEYIEFLKSLSKIAVRLKAGIVDIIRDIVSGLSVLDGILYGTLVLGEITAAAATEGLFIVAGGAIVFTSDTAFLVIDIQSAIDSCEASDTKSDDKVLLDTLSTRERHWSQIFGQTAAGVNVKLGAKFDFISKTEISQIIIGGLELQGGQEGTLEIALVKNDSGPNGDVISSWSQKITKSENQITLKIDSPINLSRRPNSYWITIGMKENSCSWGSRTDFTFIRAQKQNDGEWGVSGTDNYEEFNMKILGKNST
jgi:hypothetical protein